jgi:ABC-type transport system involved in multi-copper enzyme maturation permease subunit
MNPLWLTQIRSIIALEWKKTFFARRGLWIYLLALAPSAMFLMHSVLALRRAESGLGGSDSDPLTALNQDMRVFATVFQFFYLRLAIFFGCLGIFVNLIRGEMLDKTLHFYLLAPVKREVLIVGKFLAGLLAAVSIFTIGTALQLAFLLMRFDSATIVQYLVQTSGVQQLFAWLIVAALACLGYGSIFLAASLLVQNPIVPAAAVLFWEAINPILPTLLKKFSVIYYLKSLCPIPIAGDSDMPVVFALLVTNPKPISAVIAAASLLTLSLLSISIAAWASRRLEINYQAD